MSEQLDQVEDGFGDVQDDFFFESDHWEISSEDLGKNDANLGRLEDFGAYDATVDQVTYYHSDKGFRGFKIDVRTVPDGDSFSWFQFIENDDGKVLDWMKPEKWSAFLKVTGVTKLKTEIIDGEKRNKETKEVEKVKLRIYPEFKGKQVGIFVQKTIQEDGRIDLQLYNIYRVKDKLTASEIAKGVTVPKKFDKAVRLVSRVTDKRPIGDNGHGGGNGSVLDSNYEGL